MARKRQPHEYRFKINAYDPETMPLSQLTKYLADLAEILGEQSSVHLVRIDKSSTCPVIYIDPEAEPKVQNRITEVEREEAPPTVMDAVVRLNHRLRMDNADGAIVGPTGDNLLVFPGRQQESLEYGPVNRPGTLDGVPILVGGTRDEVSVHLEDRGGKRYPCSASRSKAKEITQYLWVKIIRVVGIGKWVRHSEGEWEMRSFKISDFTPLANLSDVSLKDSIEELRSIPAGWKQLDDPIGELIRIRQGDETI